MKNDCRIVLDTNTVVSAAILPRSTPRRAFDVALDYGSILISEETIGELYEVLYRPRFDKYLSDEGRVEFLVAYVRAAQFVVTDTRVRECRDPADDKFLELAVGGNASHVVTGDADLLALNPFRGVAIVTPRAFLDTVQSRG
jgi:uncharacterized protein